MFIESGVGLGRLLEQWNGAGPQSSCLSTALNS